MQVPKYIEIKTATGQRTAFLSPQADGLKDVYPDCRLNGESTLEFQLPANSPKIAELTPECQIWAGGRVYTLLKDEAVDIVRDDNNKLWAKFMAVERWAELDKSFIEPSLSNDPLSPIPSDLAVIIVGGGSNLSGGLYETGTAAHALYAILQDSGWTLGTCDVPGIHDLEMEKVSRLALIKEIQNIWGGYLVWDSVNKTVSLRSGNTWQNYTGFQIRYRKNLKHITRTQSNKIITKLYAFGHDDLDIASVNGGLKYITNFSYTSREYIGIYKNQDIYDAQELKEKATAELELMCRPRYLYNVKMVDLRTLPEYSHEDFSVGDMVDVIDPDVAPDSPKVRIIRHKYNLFQPWNCEMEIGDPQERLVEKLKASFSTTGFVDSKFNGNGKISGQSIEDLTITADKIADLSINAEKIEDLTITADKIANLTITGSKIANATITDAKIVSLSADKITAGTITATISINAPIIIGGEINGTEINGVLINGSHINGGTINVDTDVTIGNNLRLGYMGSTEIKKIYFNDEARIYNYLDWTGNPPTGLRLSASTIDLSDASDIYGIKWGDIEYNPFYSYTLSDFAPATGSNRYVKTNGAQNLQIQAFSDRIEVKLGSGDWNVIYFD